MTTPSQERVCHRCGQAAASEEERQCPEHGLYYIDAETHRRFPHDPLLGVALADKYPLLRILGEGGFGTVYLGQQLAEGRVLREVAIKVIRSGTSTGVEEATARFRREAEAIARLNHPNIVQLYDFGVAGESTFYMVLELVQGRTLEQCFDDEEMFTPERVEHIFRQILQALSAAHAKGIVHRDLKPENIMMVPTDWDPDYIKVLDFGLAKVFMGSSSLKVSRTNVAYGTVHYMAPEQVVGSGVDQRTDLYPLGVMLYRIYSGRKPYDAENAPIIMFKHVHSDLPQLDESVPEGVKTLIYKTLRKRPGERFESAPAMLAALKTAFAAPDQPIPGGELPRGIPRAPEALSGELPVDDMSTQSSPSRPFITSVAAPAPSSSGSSAATPSASGTSDSLAHASAEILVQSLDPPPKKKRRPVLAAIGIGMITGLLLVGGMMLVQDPEPTQHGPATSGSKDGTKGKAKGEETAPAPPAVEQEPKRSVAATEEADAGPSSEAKGADAGSPTAPAAKRPGPSTAPKAQKKKRARRKRKAKRKKPARVAPTPAAPAAPAPKPTKPAEPVEIPRL